MKNKNKYSLAPAVPPLSATTDDLASKANIIIDPAEIQASSMDDLDEDEESGAAQVNLTSLHLTSPG